MIQETTAFSKGSWQAGIQYDDEFGCPVMDESGLEVAEAKGENEDECAANALLIAAAPEMYEALRQAFSLVRLMDRPELARFMSETLDKAAGVARR